MRIGYYPGCTLKYKALNLEKSAIAALAELGVEMAELERWNCCGAVYSLADDDLIHLLAPVRDLVRAKDEGYDKLVTICSMCYNTLARANLVMKNDEEKRNTINSFMEEESDYSGEVEVLHLLNFIRDEIGWDKVKSAVKKPLAGMKLAPYYGCTLTRPHEITIDPAVTPSVFNDFALALGAEIVNFPAAEECCGSYQMVASPDTAVNLAGNVLNSAKQNGADALILSCPLCEYNLSHRQADVIAAGEGMEEIPVLYFTQLLALALGLSPEVLELGLNHQRTVDFLKAKGVA
jgi:heterodisulfide reductase subunit B